MASESRQWATLVISALAAAVLVAGVLMGMWLTVIAMALLIIAGLGTYYGRRRAHRS